MSSHSNMWVIGLMGRKRSGKDTFWSAIQRMRPDIRARRLAFADALKQEFAAAIGYDVQRVEQEKQRFRMPLQWWGTELKRADDVNYWVRQVAAGIHHAQKHGVELVVVTDVRFPNEAELIRQQPHSLLIRIERRSRFRKFLERVMGWIRPEHSSETLMDSIEADIEVDNRGSIADLENEAIRIVHGIKPTKEHPRETERMRNVVPYRALASTNGHE